MRKNNLAGPVPSREPVLCGVLLVDKPRGPTSHDMVNLVRRLAGVRKVGHAGSLDPFATGLLVMLIGRGARLFDLLSPLEKEYRVEVRFGFNSTTGDVDGQITPAAGAPVTRESLLEVLPRFTGLISQRPHRYSAVKMGGEALYRKARRGEAVEAPSRQVEVRRLELVDFKEEIQQADLLVACSKGTYIRSLCEDIAAALGPGAYAAGLRRTAVGEYRVEDAASPEKLRQMACGSLLGPDNPSFISCLGALYFLPVREVDEIEARAVATGQPLAGGGAQPVRIDYQGRLLAVYGPAGAGGVMRPLVVLA
ncbi:MAG: tRNA pseudouridine(55) synthase TruB [Thermoleophilia bacterium]|nr:tRNA pseudouridine(55) synthase TruB [Thermoleophilia bacterium]